MSDIYAPEADLVCRTCTGKVVRTSSGGFRHERADGCQHLDTIVRPDTWRKP